MQNSLLTDSVIWDTSYKKLETIQKNPQALGNHLKVTKTEKPKQTKIVCIVCIYWTLLCLQE